MKKKTETHKKIPCYFIQTGVGNIVIRLRTPDTGSGAALTLHQIVAMNVPIKEIPFFDPVKFKQFYGTDNMSRTVAYSRVVDHRDEDTGLLEHGT